MDYGLLDGPFTGEDKIRAPDRPDYNALYKAVKDSDFEGVDAALNNPSICINALFVDHEDGEGETLLHRASWNGDADIVLLLLRRGALIDSPDHTPFGMERPLHRAAKGCNAKVVEILLDHGANINVDTKVSSPVLNEVLTNEVEVESRQLETIDLLLKRGHDMDSVHIDSLENVFDQAVALCRIEIMKLLIGRGADVNSHGLGGSTPILGCAIQKKHYETARLLLEHGAKVNQYVMAKVSSTEMMELLLHYVKIDTFIQGGSLHAASTKGNASMDLVKLLLLWNFDIESLNDRGESPLQFLCRLKFARIDVVKLLLNHGANVQGKMDPPAYSDAIYRDTPLHNAIFGGHPGIVELLLEAGADVTARNQNKETPLLYVTSRWNERCAEAVLSLEILEMLLKAGSNVNAVDHQNRTALHNIAIISKHSDRKAERIKATNSLLKSGIATDIVDSDGRTANQISLDQGDYEMVEVIVSTSKKGQ